ncbi:MAG TPA: hypothetical protein ENO00_01005 [Deltaproteobacteria bacterium]|nr:hypothetical protein [Deltaproteobacteria bacterium]
MKECSVAVIGSLTVDTIIEGSCRHRQCGGTVMYSGITFKRCGIDPCIITNVADSERSLLDIFAAEGIPVRAGSSTATTHFVNYLKDNLRRQEMPCHADPVRADQIEDLVSAFQHFHIGALHPEDIAVDTLRLIGRSRKIVSVDIQGFVRYNDNGCILQRVSDRLPMVLSNALYVKADAEELDAVVEAYSTDAWGLIRRFAIEELVITQGDRGGSIICLNGDRVLYDAVPVEPVISTIGAGDVFFAAYLSSRLYRGENTVVSCETARQVAARQLAGSYITGETLCPGNLQYIIGA